MRWGILGFAIGILIGIFAPISIPIQFARYTAVMILAILDSIVGAARSDVENDYNATIFFSGLITNMLVAALITFIGDKLSLDLYLAVLVAFTIRILNNLGIVRYSLIKKYIDSKTLREHAQSEAESQTHT